MKRGGRGGEGGRAGEGGGGGSYPLLGSPGLYTTPVASDSDCTLFVHAELLLVLSHAECA